MSTCIQSIVLLTMIAVGTSRDLVAQTWETYRHDNRRSGVTDAELRFPLSSQWVYRSPQPPQMAWTGPAKWDAYSGNNGLQSMRNFDPCFYVTADDQTVYFGSSADDAAHALDIETGDERWCFFTGAAVRMPPTITDRHVYFGSDDGFAYCCEKGTGELVWSRRASDQNKRIASNRKLISLWPVRTGVMVDGDRVTFAGSLVPWEKSFLWTVDASTGKVDGEGCFQREVSQVTLQGALLASSDRLYVPQGRAAPLSFDRAVGKPLGKVGEAGGVFCLLTEDEMLFAGPPHQKERDDQIRVANLSTKQAVASFSGTNRILVAGDDAWLSQEGKLKCLDRAANVQSQHEAQVARATVKKSGKPSKELQAVIARAEKRRKASWKWEIESPVPFDMIKAGDAIILGLDGSVRAHDEANGRLLWQVDVEGAVHGLAVAKGRLFVSTDRGLIYAYGTAK